MRQSAEEKARTHERIVEIASARIREKGIEGPGVAEIMQAAGLTHGGFYKHFGSRDDLIAEAAEHAFAYADQTLDHHAHDPHDPLASWVDWYVSEEHRDDPGAGRCPVAALVGDVGRADDGVRGGYDALVERYLGVLEDMLGGGGDARQQATIAVSTLVGSLVLARAIDDDTLSDEILRTVREALRHQPMPTSEAPASL
jgi:TetR/AcrR family transcriptional regulator, transcriptional repressor for nem operon